MAILPIRVYPDPVLRARCKPVERFDEELRRLASNMVETVHAAPGIGLAAPQVGIELRLAVIDLSVGEDPQGILFFVNPVITAKQGTEDESEGCLSLPGITEKVPRSVTIRVRGVDLGGQPFELEADGLLARAIQHEIDHLEGVLFVDYLRGLRRERMQRQLRRMAREVEVHV